MSPRRIWLQIFFSLLFALAAPSQLHCDTLKDREIDASQFISPDPAFLYLRFTQRAFAPAALMTWLHPKDKRAGSYWETTTPTYVRKAFAFRLVREAPDGYEVSFQPVDPKTERALPSKDIRIFFSRTNGKPKSLTEQTSVVGFYGNPEQRPPW